MSLTETIYIDQLALVKDSATVKGKYGKDKKIIQKAKIIHFS
jgi:hypothetical protein